MIQLNLLPDVKLDYIKTRKTKRLVLLGAGGVAGVTVSIMILLFVVVNFLQKQHISNLTADIAAKSQTLENIDDLDQILTIQNQLQALTGLHDQKPESTRLFKYLKKTVPNKVRISQLDLDYETRTLTFTGSADRVEDVNTFVDTLKFTTFEVDGTANNKAFSSVVLSSFSRNEVTTSYQITTTFEPTIFDITKQVKMVVPETVTTRSETERPGALFEQEEEN